MMDRIEMLPTPVVVVDRDRLVHNIAAMQDACTACRVELWPHVKTHKSVAIARLQLAHGAAGLTCAKLGEAEAMLASGVRRIFVAHSLVDANAAPRLAALHARLDLLLLAVTSLPQAEALAQIVIRAGVDVGVMLAVDAGLGREGVRNEADAVALATFVGRQPGLTLRGLYTHEGHLYAVPPAELPARVGEVMARLRAVRDAIGPRLPLWPGCSVTARMMTAEAGVAVVRPGAYVFGDLALAEVTQVMRPAEVALSVVATVVDLPEPGLALIDAGSKVFSSDRTAEGVFARVLEDGRDLAVVRVNEEHGYVRGKAVGGLRIGERLRFTPAHVCPVVNLTDELVVMAGAASIERWPVEARGRVR